MDVREKLWNYASTASGSAAGSSAGASIAGSGSGSAAAGSSAGYDKEVIIFYHNLTTNWIQQWCKLQFLFGIDKELPLLFQLQLFLFWVLEK